MGLHHSVIKDETEESIGNNSSKTSPENKMAEASVEDKKST
jgi:hypothetical protein